VGTIVAQNDNGCSHYHCQCRSKCRVNRAPLSLTYRCGNLWGVDDDLDFHGASAGRTAPPVRPLSLDQQPATKADLCAAVDALRADMRELMDQVRTLIQVADRQVSELERARDEANRGLPNDRRRLDHAEW